MYKLLKSAINNWEQKNSDEKVENAGLIVKTIMVDGGRVIKRMRPAPQGRGYRVRKRSNHVTIIVDSNNRLATLPAKKVAAKAEPVVVDEPAQTKEKSAPKAKKTVEKTAAVKKEATKKAPATKKAKPAEKKAEKESAEKNTLA